MRPTRSAPRGTLAKETESSPPESVARQIGEYRIVREIGRGGMGIVYEAHQKSLNRQVALKILPFAAVLDQRQIARFRNEAQAAAQLHHPHIVPVFAVGQEQGVYYYAMQLIDGQSLEQVIAQLRNEAEAIGQRLDESRRWRAWIDQDHTARAQQSRVFAAIAAKERLLSHCGAARERSGFGIAACPRVRHCAPRREAIELADRRARRTVGHRFRPGACKATAA